jgi:hypothetical protein
MLMRFVRSCEEREFRHDGTSQNAEEAKPLNPLLAGAMDSSIAAAKNSSAVRAAAFCDRDCPMLMRFVRSCEEREFRHDD